MRHDALLDHCNDMVNGVTAIVFQPFGNDRHQTVDIKRHDIVPVLFRHLKAFQNRRKHMAEHFVIGLTEPQGGGVLHRCAEQAFMVFDVAQIRRQICRSGQIQFFKRTIPQSRNDTGGVWGDIIQKLAVKIGNALREQIAYRFIVQRKGGTVDPCFFTDFLYRDIGKILHFQQRQKRLVHADSGIEIFAFGLIQKDSPFFRIFLLCSSIYTAIITTIP